MSKTQRDAVLAGFATPKLPLSATPLAVPNDAAAHPQTISVVFRNGDGFTNDARWQAAATSRMPFARWPEHGQPLAPGVRIGCAVATPYGNKQ